VHFKNLKHVVKDTNKVDCDNNKYEKHVYFTNLVPQLNVRHKIWKDKHEIGEKVDVELIEILHEIEESCSHRLLSDVEAKAKRREEKFCKNSEHNDGVEEDCQEGVDDSFDAKLRVHYWDNLVLISKHVLVKRAELLTGVIVFNLGLKPFNKAVRVYWEEPNYYQF